MGSSEKTSATNGRALKTAARRGASIAPLCLWQSDRAVTGRWRMGCERRPFRRHSNQLMSRGSELTGVACRYSGLTLIWSGQPVHVSKDNRVTFEAPPPSQQGLSWVSSHRMESKSKESTRVLQVRSSSSSEAVQEPATSHVNQSLAYSFALTAVASLQFPNDVATRSTAEVRV